LARYNAGVNANTPIGGKTHGASELVFASRWKTAAIALDAERLRTLRSLTEEAAAQRFALLLAPREIGCLRPTSGLVEQQRIFDRLRRRAP
jgi:hypothetical protein